jgi:hypothetical protein
MHSADHPIARRSAQRHWIVEALVVVGVLAFGYLAMTHDTTLPAPAGSMLTEIFR